jgi:membrane protease YdiL (CAAX protease family)
MNPTYSPMRIVAVGDEPLPLRAWPAIRLLLWYFGGQIAAGLLLGIGLAIWAAITGHDYRTDIPAAIERNLIPLAVLSTIASAWILVRKTRKALPSAAWPTVLAGLGWRPATRAELQLGVLLGMGLAATYLFGLTQLFPPKADQSFGPMATAVDSASLFGRLLFAATAVLVAPPVEEFLFRGILLAGFGRSWGFGPAAVGVTALFALAHITEVRSYWPALFGIALFASVSLVLRLRTRSLWPSICLHASYNGVLMLTLLTS